MKQAHILQVSWVQWKLTNTLSNTRESASLLLFHLMALLWWEKWKEECNKRQKMVALDYRSVGNWLSAHTHTHWHTGTRAVRRPPLPGTVCTNDRMVESLPSCQYSSVAVQWGRPDDLICLSVCALLLPLLFLLLHHPLSAPLVLPHCIHRWSATVQSCTGWTVKLKHTHRQTNNRERGVNCRHRIWKQEKVSRQAIWSCWCC